MLLTVDKSYRLQQLVALRLATFGLKQFAQEMASVYTVSAHGTATL